MAQEYIRVNNTLTNILDSNTGEYVTYDKVTEYADGTPMDDTKCDGVIYRKLGDEFFRRNYSQYINVKWFGAKGDFSDDTNTGTDDTTAFQKAIDTLIRAGGGTLFIPKGRYLVNGTIFINPLNQESIYILGETASQKNTNNLFSSTIATTVSNHDIIRTNLNDRGETILPANQQWTNFSIKGINFKVKAGATGVNAIRNFRTRSLIEDVSGFGLDYLIIQDNNDTLNNLNYCDQSLYYNIRLNQTNLGGIKLIRADGSIINGFYLENPRETTKYAIEITRSSGIDVSGLVFWSPEDYAPIIEGAYFRSLYNIGVNVRAVHLERVFFESTFDIIGTEGFRIDSLESRYSSNNMFHIRASSDGVVIENWYSNEVKKAGTYDIKVAGTVTKNITYRNCKFLEYDTGSERIISILNTDAPFGLKRSESDSVVVGRNANVNITRDGACVFLLELEEDKNIILPDPLKFVGGRIVLQNRTTNFNWSFSTIQPRDYLGRSITTMPLNTTLIIESIGGNWRVISSYDDMNEAISTRKASDNNLAASVNSLIFLPNITANRTLSLPLEDSTNKFIRIINSNNSNFDWIFSTPILHTDGSTLSIIPKRGSLEIVFDGVNWRVLSLYVPSYYPIELVGTTLDFSLIQNNQLLTQDISTNTTYTFSNRVAGKKIEFSILNTSASDVTVDFSEGVVIADSNIIPAGKEAIVSIIAVRASYRIGIVIQS